MARFSRLSRSISIPLAILLAAVPGIAFGSVGFFGPVLPQSGSCHCPNNLPLDWGCVVQVIQNLIQLAVSLGVILCVIWIAYAGFSLMVSGGSPEARSQGKTRITNALFGILVILCSWLVVDFVMKVLYEPNTALEGGVFGPWNTILQAGENNYCIQPHTPTAISAGSILTGLIGTATNLTPGTGSGNYGTTGAQCSVSNQACSVNTLQGNGLSSSQANVMSCIAVTESSGVPSTPPYNQTHPGSNSSACGTFQIVQKTWNRTATGACASFSNCTNAACNAQVATTLVKNSGYSSWTCPGCNNKAQGCVVKYGGS